jgi:hypothetical protein
MRMSHATHWPVLLPNICVPHWRSIGHFRLMRNSKSLWLNSSNGMPRYNDDYRISRGAHEELTSIRKEGNEVVRRSTVLDDHELELDIDSAWQNLEDKDSRRELDETRDS